MLSSRILRNTKCGLVSFLLFLLGIGYVFYQTIFLNNDIIMLKINTINNSSIPLQRKLGRNITFKVLTYAYPKWYTVPRTMEYCEFQNCVSSFNKKDMIGSHLVLFHHSNLNFHPPIKYPQQIWGFMSWESPCYTHRSFMRKEWSNKFDWIISYHPSSEGYGPFNKIIKKTKQTVKKNYDQIFERKLKKIAWIVSHCKTSSRRMEYAKRMRRLIDIDIFGNCGKPCPTSGLNCLKDISSDYMFYLSFENSISNDYATEKIFNIFGNDIDIVPVVRGAPNVKSLIPNDTFISTADYQSPEELAFALKNISNNRSVYLELLKRKDKFIKTNGGMVAAAFCSICRQLNIDRGKRSDIKKMMSMAPCLKPTDLS